MGFVNAYGDADYADAYSKLEFPGTYYLAYRDLPKIISEHIMGKKAVDFGCGAGRSTRFLGKLGFDVTGIDISYEMIQKAKAIDPQGDYRHITEGEVGNLSFSSYDLVLSVFTFDNIPTGEKKRRLLHRLSRLLKNGGKIVSLVSSPEIYTHEWISFSTKDYPENRHAKTGDRVKIIITAIEDKRPVEDILWTDSSYLDIFAETQLKVVQKYKPLGLVSEPYPWVNETQVAPWTIYVLESI